MGIGVSLILIAAGAILTWAVNVSASGFNINTIGLILLIVGIVAFVAGLAVFVMGSSRRTTVSEDVRMTPGGGQERVAERRDSGI